MSYQIFYDDKRKIAELKFNNPISLAEKKMARNQAVNICVNKKAKRVLVDMSKIITAGNMQILDLYEFGATWSYEILSGPIKYAIVLPEDRRSKEDINFLITVGLNRGVFIKSFLHRDGAIEWLENTASN